MALDVIWHDQVSILDPTMDVIGDGFDLGAGVALTDDEEIGGCILYAPQIQLKDVLPFDILDGIDDHFVEIILRPLRRGKLSGLTQTLW